MKWCLAIALVACGGAPPKAGMAMAPPGAVAPQASTPQIAEQMVVEGSIALEVDNIADIVPALRAQVEAAGGHIASEVVSGAAQSWSAQLKLRLPPAKVQDVVTFLASRGDITSKNISATDVSRQLFDQDLEIANLKTTLDRLTQLMATGGLQVQQILQIEQEMTRIRGQIEQLEGDQRFLKDRVGLATLDISIARREGAVTVAKAKFYPGVRAAMLTLLDPGARKATRFGGGVVVHPFLRALSLEVDVFDKAPPSSSVSAIATIGTATYSDFLGAGRRRTLNPYLGIRAGYAYLDTSRFVVQGEVGVELFKATYVVVDANIRGTGLVGDSSDFAIVTGLGATVAF